MDSNLPLSVQARITPGGALRGGAHPARDGSSREAPDPRASRLPGDGEHRPRFAGTCDTAVDPLQLIWLVARERDDFTNF